MNQNKEISYEAWAEETLLKAGWNQVSRSDWDSELALFPSRICDFIKVTQPVAWKKMEALHGSETADRLVQTLAKELDHKGTVHVLRHGFKFYGQNFRTAYFQPAHQLSEEVTAQWKANQLGVTRQVPFHPARNQTVDMLLSVNGIPVATLELKNPGNGQTWANAVSQYKESRDPSAPLFRFKARALVHFAVDTDEVHMSTRMQKSNTRFLPFNKGSHPGEIVCGRGNPEHHSGYRAGYFWEEVLHPVSFMDILGNFIFIEKKQKKEMNNEGEMQMVTREQITFPRYHQWDAVSKIVNQARKEGSGHNYLIQHSAGSGKTNTISWLSHRLASLHNPGGKKIFDCVVVITDRKVLDQQLQDAIYQIEHQQGVVKAIDDDSKQLAEALVDGTMIVITTLQKFPFVLKGLMQIAKGKGGEETAESKQKAKDWEKLIASRRYAVIVDEAHSSQSGETAREMKGILGASIETADEEALQDWEDNLNEIMASRGRQPNLSFFAFTATPKGKTLEFFGREGLDSLPEPFHLYSMRQAIEENFILDVLENYTTYATYFKLLKSIDDDPQVLKKRGMTELAKFLNLHPYNISQKTEVIIEHFRNNVARKLNGRAKAMVVTGSRLQAVRYKLAFDKYIEENNYSDVRPVVAFSGKVRDSETGKEYTEPSMNLDPVSNKPISEASLPEKFDTDDFNVLLVANKYQTGFDQPLLLAMYVDKRLDGVQAVQTLSRLNRMIPGKETPFVLDFVNSEDEIFKAFKPYFDSTRLREKSDPSKLEQLKHDLMQFQVIYQEDIESFAAVFYKPSEKQGHNDHSKMQKFLQPAKTRFDQLYGKNEKQQFRDLLAAFVNLYSYMTHIIPWPDAEQEKLFSYGKLLLPHLQIGREQDSFFVEEEVSLQYYRLQRISSGSINLRNEGEIEVNSPTQVGTGKPNEAKVPLSELIQTLNDNFGTDFRDDDRLLFVQIRETAINDPEVQEMALANNSADNFELGIQELLTNLFIRRMSENEKITTRYLEDNPFRDTILRILSREIYRAIKERG